MRLSLEWWLGEEGASVRRVRELAKLSLGFSGGDEDGQLRIPGGAASSIF